MKKRRTIERCVRLGVAIACVSAATVLRAGDRAEVSVAGSERADTASFRDIYPDTWVATDAVGRTMPTEEEVGLPKNDQRRVVGIFYITWHTQGLHNLKSPYTADVTKILEQDPSARLDAHHPLWKEGSYHWGEPEMGYFLSQDEWVIRKDVSMLADAGVDVMIMDVTNAVRYWDEWDVIFRTMQRMKAEGNKVPKFCFWAFNGPVITVVQDLYDRIYKPGLYSDLWFEWDGKPLLLYNSRPGIDAAESSNPNTNPHYDPDAVTNPANPHYGDPDYTEKVYKDYTSEVKDFFTLRTMWWGYYEWGGERFVGTEDNWSFGYNMADPKVAALKPEELLSTHNGRREQAAVTPAQHPMTMGGADSVGVGKSWSRASGEPQLDEHDLPVPTYVPWLGKTVEHPEHYGIYFQERWDEALACDPEFLYINDWNEWTAGQMTRRHEDYDEEMRQWDFFPGANCGKGGRKIEMGESYFIDQYNQEYSRDIEPMKGGHGDGGRPPVQGCGRAGRGGTGADDRPERRVRPVEAGGEFLFRSCGRHVSPRQPGQFRGRALCEPDRTQRYRRIEGGPGRPLRLFLCPNGRSAHAAYRSVVDAAVHRCRRRSLDRLGRLRPAGQRVVARRPPHGRENLWTRRLGEACDDRLSL